MSHPSPMGSQSGMDEVMWAGHDVIASPAGLPVRAGVSERGTEGSATKSMFQRTKF